MVKISSYTATLSPLGESGVSGEVKLFMPTSGPLEGMVCFVGSAIGLEPALDSVHLPGGTGSDCSATNGCGVHIHTGSGEDACTNSITQGGHWWNEEFSADDPWKIVGYFGTSDHGTATYADCVQTGYAEGLDSRAFIVHANDGSRVACGLMEPDNDPTIEMLSISTDELSGSGVGGEVTVVKNLFAEVPDGVCFVGSAAGLEADLASIHNGGGMACGATNGCGVHIHAGNSCESADSQGGHFYDKGVLPVDPWLIVGYSSTDRNGAANFADCVLTGEAKYEGKPFIIHADDGSRVSCGLLSTDEQAPTEASSGTSFVGAGFASALVLLHLFHALMRGR